MFTFNTTNSGISQLLIGSAASGTGIEGLKDSNGKYFKLLGKDAAATPLYQAVTYVANSGQLTIGGANPVQLTALVLGITFPTGATDAEKQSLLLEAAIRNGLVTVSSESDEFTQTSVYINSATPSGQGYELRDWRTLPEIADELFKGDDMDAENKYDRIVSQINQQDKKLQLEQASVEVEYKAISSEKEAVKKILDTNASASFKYFS